MATKRTPAEVLAYAKESGAEILDLRFADLPGLWQHVSYPIAMLEEDSFEDGFGFDGSSIRGWQAISESDMLIMPDPNTAFMDPFTEVPTLCIISNIVDPITKQHYERDPRWIAQKAEQYLQYTGVGDTAYFGAEAEFFLFDNVSYDSSYNFGFYKIDSEEGRWNSGRPDNNLGYRPRYKEGYFPVPPTDHLQDLRTEMTQVMERCGIEIECHHHEVATGGQCEIDQRFDTLVLSSDNMMLYKYVVRNVAYRNGKSATFMPKPLWNDNGSGMHTHQSIWKDGEPTFAATATPASARPPCTTSAGCSSTLRRWRRSSPRRPTATSAWCPASKLRSAWPTRAATAPRPAASRCTRPARSRSASNCAIPIRRATPIWPSPPA